MPASLLLSLTRYHLLLAAGLLAVGLALLGGSWLGRRQPDPSVPPVRIVWRFEAGPRGGIAAAPAVSADTVLVSCIRDDGFRTGGAVYALDRLTGAVRWQFDDAGAMLHTISTPLLSEERVYVGEGMHGDLPCRLYCLEARTGKYLWDQPVGGHIESGPRTDGQRVYVTAGDDGLLALDARSGAVRWRHAASGHVDAPPWVAAGLVHGGSGVSRRHARSEVFCLEVATGRPVWRVETALPVWGGPVRAGSDLFVPLGNGRLTAGEPPPGRPAGALLCLDANNGQERWRCPATDSVMAAPCRSAGLVHFTSRDGRLYTVDAHDGRRRWRHDLGSPVVTTPCLAGERLYVASTAGRVAALDRVSGTTLWSLEIAEMYPATPRLLGSPVVTAGPDGQPWLLVGTELRGRTQPAAVLLCLEDVMANRAGGR